jgi:translation initiation factor IF-2
MEDWPADNPGRSIYLLEQVVVRDLASALGVKPFKIVGELLELKQFKNADDEIDFETASIIARKHGYRAERPPPGVLVL